MLNTFQMPLVNSLFLTTFSQHIFMGVNISEIAIIQTNSQ